MDLDSHTGQIYKKNRSNPCSASDPAEAKHHFNRALELTNHNYPDAENGIAILYLCTNFFFALLLIKHIAEGRFTDARFCVQQVLERDPNHSASVMTSGLIYWKTNDHEKALKEMKRSYDLKPDDITPATYLSEVCPFFLQFF